MVHASCVGGVIAGRATGLTPLTTAMTGRSKITLDPAVELLSDKYEVLDVLGGGGMGRVYRARHRQLKRWVAIKLLHQHIGGEEAVARFLREARAAAQIASTHVAHVMDAGVLSNGNPYIVMEHLNGRDLARWLREDGRLAVTQAVDFMLQALEALAEAHALQIVHRDIKPDNLFATRGSGGDISIKVLDFGLAKAGPALAQTAPDITERGVMLGTPRYMAPEQFSDAQQADVRSDIWSFGATLFELVTGAPPFAGETLPQIYRAVMHRALPSIRSLVPELPEGLEHVVATCLTRERELRFADAAEVAAALRPWAGPAAVERIERICRIVEAARDVRSRRDQTPPSAADPPSAVVVDPLQRRRLPWVTLGLSVVSGTGFLWLASAYSARGPEPEVVTGSTEASAAENSRQHATTHSAISPLTEHDAAQVEQAAPSGTPAAEPAPPAAAPSEARPKRNTARRPNREPSARAETAPGPSDPASAYEDYP